MTRYLDVKQGDEEWLDARTGIPTASEFHNLVTPLWKVKTGAAVETYLHKKIAERCMGRAPLDYSGGAMEQGSVREGEALPWYKFAYKKGGVRRGFWITDDGSVGASPDGVFDDGTGIEIKCPAWHTHVGYRLAGGVPPQYLPQVQGGMYVTGLKRWVFLSYVAPIRRLRKDADEREGDDRFETKKMEQHVVEVERDPKAMDALAKALAAFNERLRAGYERMVDINGGEPR